MKKLISMIAAAAVCACIFAGCAGDENTGTGSVSDTDTSVSGETLAADGSVSPDGYEKTFDGFVKYMTDSGYVSGDGDELTAAAIGADKGRRYKMSSTVSKHTVELYEFTDQTSDAAKKTIANARTDHSFHLFESTETQTKYTYAAVSADGRFLMLYTDSSETDGVSEQKQSAGEAVEVFSK